ncbi:MAG: hypothetical protein ABIQ02_16640 [Saprospiraceae bacterium]
MKDKNDPVIPDPSPTYYTFEGSIGTNDNSTIITNDQNLLISGTNSGKVCLLKISESGLLLWRKDFEENSGPLTSVVQSTDHNIFLCGYTYRNVFSSDIDVLLVKTNEYGDTIWSKTYGGTSGDFGYYIRNGIDGNLLVGGISFSHSSDHASDIYLMKVNLNGDTVWTRTYVDPGVEIPHHLLQMGNGEILITGYESNTSKGVYLLKLNAQGSPLWNKKISSPVPQEGLSTIELPNGDLVTCGKSTRDSYDKVLVIKFDSFGNVLWGREYGDEYYSEQGNSITINTDGTFTITGTYFEPHSGQNGIIILKLDADGNQLVLKSFGEGFDDSGQNILKDENGDNIITGNHNGNIFMTRTDNNGVFK